MSAIAIFLKAIGYPLAFAAHWRYHAPMSLETDIFQRRRIEFASLIDFGCTHCPSGYLYTELFLNGQFRAEIHISLTGEVTGRVIECDSGEEYLPLHVEGQTGSFVGVIRENYTKILQAIAAHCTTAQPFLHAQANRLAEQLLLRYGDKPDFPFKKLPAYGVFRHAGSRKWYALIMNIPRARLLHKKKICKREQGDIVEILNIKVAQAQLEALHNVEGIYPCYHMNRANWVSILLEEILPDKRILELVAASRAATATPVSCVAHGNVWLVPANPAYFDVEGAFASDDRLLWKQYPGIKTGDVVYMYLGAPISAIRFRCEVVETGIPYAYEDAHLSMRQVMRIRQTHVFATSCFPLAVLKTYGVHAVRGPRRIPDALRSALETAGTPVHKKRRNRPKNPIYP